jgi:uncharacterized protein YjdB
MKRKLVSTLLVIAMLLFMLPIGTFAALTPSYSDSANHWAQPAIEKWSGMGIVKGLDGKFRPNDPITRGELAVIIDRIMKYQTAGKNSFSDLGQAFYTDAVLKANKAGVMKGDGSKIRPNDKITREEAVVIIGRSLGLAEKTGSSSFNDGAGISKWATGYINSAAERGYIKGSNNLFKPKTTITRAEVVTILDNAITQLYAKANEYSAAVTGTVIVNTSGAVLKNMKITGDLIISEGVGTGDVTLNNVTVTGKTIVRGGGANSIHITGNSNISSIIILKTDTGKIRVVTSDSAVVEVVYVNDGNDDIILTGSFKNVNVAAGASVSAVGADIKSLNITSGNASINIDKSSKASEVKVANTAAGTSLSISGTVGTLTADAKISVKNDGTITKAVVNANGVTIGGTAPVNTDIGSNVTEPPKINGTIITTTTTTATTSGSIAGTGAGTGNDPGGSNPPAATIAVTGITLDKTTMTLTAGGITGTLTATVAPANATNKNVTWTSSNTAAAIVSNGIVTPVAAGTTTITATTVDGGKTATCQVTVNAAAIVAVSVTGITLDKTTMTLTAGGAPGTLIATVTPAGATYKTVTWTSSNNTIATVSNGIVTPVAAGTTTITATTVDGGLKATCQVTVNAAYSVVSGKKTGTTYGDYTYVNVSGLTPYVYMPTGAGSSTTSSFMTVTGMMNTYGKSNNIVAAINAGILFNTPDSKGKQYGFNYKEADGVVISNGVVLKSTESLDQSECEILVVDEDGNVGYTDYYADADKLVAGTGYYYDIKGNKVTGKKIISAVTGFVPIVIEGKSVYDTTDTNLNGYHNYVNHYTENKVRQIFGVKADGSYGILTNDKATASLWTLAKAADAAKAEGFVFAYNLDGESRAETVLGTGSDDSYSVQTLVPQMGDACSLPTYIVFTANNVAPVSATANTINATLSSSNFDAGITLGAIKARLMVNEIFTNANGQESTRKLFSQTGLDMSQTLQQKIIGGGAMIEDCTVKKTSSSPNGTMYFQKNDTQTNTISLKYNQNSRQGGKYYDYSTGYTLSIADDVDLNIPGNKVATVSYTPGGGLAPLTSTLNISLREVIPVTGISLDKSTLALDAGGSSGILKATVLPAKATYKDVTWTSSTPQVAIVTANGEVIPDKAGTTTISAITVEGGFTATCAVTVTVAEKSITLNKSKMALSSDGLTGTLKANLLGLTNKNVIWTSSNTAAAIVTNGTVTPLATGTAIITATTVEESKTATCQVTVNEKAVAYENKTDATYGTYTTMSVSGLMPHVFNPIVTGTGAANDFQSPINMMRTYGKSNNIVVAINSGIFYNAGPTKSAYCYRYKEPDGVLISNGVVLKSTESIDHTGCDILVFDEDGNVGWTDYYADADAMVKGTGYYYDINGKTVTGKKIVNALVGFVPILIGGNSQYKPNGEDPKLNGLHNYVGHYMGQSAIRTIIGVKADGSYGILSGAWKMDKAAEAAKAEGFVFAYNCDGGGSTEIVVATGSGDSYTTPQAIVAQSNGTRELPTYIVFTSNNVAPVTPTPDSITAAITNGASFAVGNTLGDITQNLTVTEKLINAKGVENTRTLYSRQGVDTSQKLTHILLGGNSVSELTERKKDENVPNGTLYYTKNDVDINQCVPANGNTRQSEKYYDYSTGYTLSTTDDLNTIGEKTIMVSYIPGDGRVPLTTTIKVIFGAATKVTGITLDKTTMTLTEGGITGKLTATVAPASATVKTVTWESSNTGIATVSNGTVTPVAEGTVTISAITVDGGFTSNCVVTVNPAIHVTSITLDKATMSLDVGGATGKLTATVLPAEATYKNFTWTSSNTAAAIVANGTVTPVAGGTSTITVTTVDGGLTATCEVTVNAFRSVTGITLDQTTMTLTEGGITGTLSPLLAPSNATNQNVKWTTDDSGVAAVSNGVITPLAAGITTITAITVDGGLTATCQVTVLPAKILLNKIAMALVAGGSSGTLKATVTPAGASYTWSSSDLDVATVSNGTVAPKAVGTTTISAITVDGFTATCRVTVNAAAMTTGSAISTGAAAGPYKYINLSGLTPYVYAPTGAGSSTDSDFLNVVDMMNNATYGGKLNNIVVAINAGLFYSPDGGRSYCYNLREADGVLISNGVVLKSVESIYQTESDVLVIDEDGNVGYTDYYADADKLVSGEGYYRDIRGKLVTGKKIISAVTGFVPFVINGKNVYNAADTKLSGYHNYVSHYTAAAPRQIFGVKADGSYGVLTSGTYADAKWTLNQAAELAIAEGFVFAYNFEGGSTAGTTYATGSGDSYAVTNFVPQNSAGRRMPTYLVFTANNVAPVSATPDSITVTTMSGATYTCGVTLGAITQNLTVAEKFTSATGNESTRRIYSQQGLDMSQKLQHTIIGGTTTSNSVKKTSESPNGSLVWTKTAADVSNSLGTSTSYQNNTRGDNKYYDYSTGYTLSTTDDLNMPGVKNITVSYTPGDGRVPLTTTISIVLVTPGAIIVTPTGISLDKPTMTLTAGGITGTLAATVTPADATNKLVTWTSSNNSVATVSNGTVTPVAVGTTTITAITVEGGIAATCQVMVKSLVPVTGVTLDKTAMTLTAGGITGTLTATVTPASAINKAVTWTSSNDAIATVSNGTVTPVAPGTTTISAITVEGGFTAACQVTVNAIPVTAITLDKATMNLTAGGITGTLTATVAPSNAYNKTVTWTSSNSTVATVSNGTVTPAAEGTTTITATTSEGGFTATCVVTVVPLPITLNKTAMALVAGGLTGTLKASVTPAGASYTWESSNEAVATVSNGTVTPLAVGTTTISAITVGSGFTATCLVTVKATAMTNGTTTSAITAIGAYKYVNISGLTPHIFVPTGAGSTNQADFLTVNNMLNSTTYGAIKNNIIVAANTGHIYNQATAIYGFNGREADGVVISNGVVLKSVESIGQTESDILVVDEDGNVGYTDYFADADKLVAGEGYYNNVYGKKVTGKKIISAVTGFVPFVIDGKNQYNANGGLLKGYHNYVTHYDTANARQIFGVKADGSFGILNNNSSPGWKFDTAAQAAIAEGFVFAWNFEGGSGTQTYVVSGGAISPVSGNSRQIPAYLVFTSNNVAPVSATPSAITATTKAGATFTCGVTLGAITQGLTVTESFVTAHGNKSTRKLYSQQALDMSLVLQHELRTYPTKGSVTTYSSIRTSHSPNGSLVYTKTTPAETSTDANGTRADRNYYDYSTGYTLSTSDDLSTPGVKTITVSYIPGNGHNALTTTVNINVTGAVPVTGISLDQTALAFKVGDAPVTLVATVTPAGASYKNVTWTSSNPNVATVSNGGTVAPVAEGTAIITVKTVDGGLTATCAVTVTTTLVGASFKVVATAPYVPKKTAKPIATTFGLLIPLLTYKKYGLV